MTNEHQLKKRSDDQTASERRVETVEEVETTPLSLISSGDLQPAMGVTHQQPDATSGIEKTVDLTQYSLPLPDTARAAQVTITGDASSFRIDVVRKNRWVIEGQLNSAHVTGVYHESQPVDLPVTVPRWLALVLHDLEIGIDEVSI